DLYVTGVQTCALPICPMLHAIGPGPKLRQVGDLGYARDVAERLPQRVVRHTENQRMVAGLERLVGAQRFVAGTRTLGLGAALPEIGRASCRERVWIAG